jgi:hypothetical protein
MLIGTAVSLEVEGQLVVISMHHAKDLGFLLKDLWEGSGQADSVQRPIRTRLRKVASLEGLQLCILTAKGLL